MKLHQILHCGPDGAPPSSFGACLVFPAPIWSRLQARIGELQHEKQDERKHYKLGGLMWLLHICIYCHA